MFLVVGAAFFVPSILIPFSASIGSLIRCWDSASFHEKYRITAGLGGVGTGPELCIWSLLFLR